MKIAIGVVIGMFLAFTFPGELTTIRIWMTDMVHQGAEFLAKETDKTLVDKLRD